MVQLQNFSDGFNIDFSVCPRIKKISSKFSGNLFRACNSSVSKNIHRSGSRTAATSKMERFVIIVNGWKPLANITMRSILDVAAVLDPTLIHLCVDSKTGVDPVWTVVGRGPADPWKNNF